MCRTWPLFLLLTGLAPASLSAQEGGCDSQARGAGDGDFVLDLDRRLPPVGPRMYGVVDPAMTPVATEFFGELQPAGGLHRANRRMDVLANRAGRSAELVQYAHAIGMRSHLTCVGTPRSNATGNPPTEEWHTLPGYARTPPADMQLWADELVAMLAEMEAEHGVLPDQIEIWNEPDREEWWSGTDEEYLQLYFLASRAVKAAFPQVLVGGPAQASSESLEDGSTSTLLEKMVLLASARGNPLDFVSWHHYGAANELRYRCTVKELRTLAHNSGLSPAPRMIVSEWNIYPNGGESNPRAIELDGSHAAAQVAGFLSSAVMAGLDANCFFMVQDVEDGQFDVLDLTGAGNGVFTHRGVKKPVYRLMEFLYPMALQDRLNIQYPVDEWSASAFASLLPSGDVRLVAANDVLDEQWVWSNACRERGALPGALWNAVDLLNDLGLPVTIANLVNLAGLAAWEADVVMDVMPIAEEAQWIARHARVLRFQVRNGTLAPVRAWRFDASHNAPATRRDEILPDLTAIEENAQQAAWNAAAAYFDSEGITLPDPWTITEWPGSPQELAAMLHTTLSIAERGWELFYATLEAERLADRVELNELPATRLTAEDPLDALVVQNGTTLEITLQPNAVTVVDLALLP
ncbi:MAG: hypothetical protein EYC70_02805 [Planctomycetota bacterium]|nr:MAG: hypothetical protein EYC70_02805 [Planctomycetota bacterium]